ncbi:MAG: extracellular solute-binding protein [Micrococcales bacterium]|uniref:ABC transporter substrate-binding protein n=1 Tax=Phycicoccus sp. TaxID=1902410 RepID=UPI001992CB11|nr:extracellular solute-binding protein [Phycicoccus sp.]MBD3783790.1 extracellular solute-binding protein [Micrococcales bacterium]HMM96769.1 extracellular solute-binding protein [Phycicoccus sp.]
MGHTLRPHGRRALFGAAVAVALVAAGCAPGSSGGGSDTAASSGAVSTAVPPDKVTLKLAFTDSPDMTKALVDAFHAKYPQVTIETQYTQFNDYVKSLKLSMSSDTAPDIAQYNAALKDLSAAGLIVDLSGYEKAYDWDTVFPKSALDELRVDKTGKVLGTGSLVAVPAGLSLVGLYYNKDLMAKAGISAPPATVDELEADLAKAKQAGLTGMAVGGLDTGALHVWGSLMDSMTDPTAQRNWINGKAGSSIVTDDAVAATDTFASWAKQGWFPSSANGTSENDSATAFSKGGSVFHVNGNWAAAQLGEAMGDNVGFSVFPPKTKDAKAVGNGFSVSYMLSSKGKHQAAAAAFLDFLRSPEAAVIESKGGFLPPNAEAAPAATGVQADLATANQKIVSDDGLMPFPDFAAPAMLDKLTSGLQQVAAGRMDSKAFLQSLQEVWDSYHGS